MSENETLPYLIKRNRSAVRVIQRNTGRVMFASYPQYKGDPVSLNRCEATAARVCEALNNGAKESAIIGFVAAEEQL